MNLLDHARKSYRQKYLGRERLCVAKIAARGTGVRRRLEASEEKFVRREALSALACKEKGERVVSETSMAERRREKKVWERRRRVLVEENRRKACVW